ncbi:MAG: alpha-N-arabinofuranosidase [Verrucomicrobia bacterium]|nr:alpha-N-arabinofuranosidase [Verrucomicrobiota bacterium]
MKSTLHLDPRSVIGEVDPRIFGGFLEHLGRAVYEGVYDPDSAHADESGCRTDVMDALRDLRFTAMRYPGGNFVGGYHWLDAVGPREQRPTVTDHAWKSLEPNTFGSNEFIDLARRMGWTPMMAVNLGSGSPEEARNWLDYCNTPVESMGSDLRTAHGYPEPHNIKLWCLGNEMDGPWQIGHVPAAAYADKARQTARLMRTVDPEVELVACGSCAIDLPTYLEWDRTVLEHGGDDFDYISLHRYVGNPDNDTANYLAVTNSIDAQIEAMDAVCLAAQRLKKLKKRAYLSFDEWNVWYRARDGEHQDGHGKFAPHLLEESYNLEDALVVAGFLNSFIRHADSVKIANLAQIVNVIAPIMTRGDELLRQTTFYPFAMMARRRKGKALRLNIEGPTYTSRSYGDVSYLDASAILDGNRVSVFAVNRSLDTSMELNVNLAGARVGRVVDAEIVSGNDPKEANTFEHPANIVSQPFGAITINGAGTTLTIPPHAFVAMTVALA